MKDRSYSRFFVGFTLGTILVLLVGGISYYTLRQQSTQSDLVKHTYKILNQAAYVENLVVDMETGRRGFRCTNDRQFLEPYYRSQPKLAPEIARLKALVADNKSQSAQVDQLAADAQDIDSFYRGINLSTIFGDTEQKIYVTRTEKVLIDKVRADINAIASYANESLAVRESTNSSSIGKAIVTLVSGTLLILVVVFLLMRLIIKQYKSRTVAENALHDKLYELNQINLQTNETNWLLEGMREINGSLIGNDSLTQLCTSCLNQIVDYMGLPAGAFYFYDSTKKVLVLSGSVALPADIQQTVGLNEGITGNAATQKEVVIINDIPANYWKIESAAGAALPDTVVCIPLWIKSELAGVIELACFAGEVTKYVSLMEAVADNIAIAVYGADAKDKMYQLLSKVQEQKEELESQQEELRQTNEELTHQADILKASEEELTTQGEELRQMNVELEEKTEVIEAASRALVEKAAELEVSSRYKSEFLANMSHELRTPLNSVLILANLLRENKTNTLTAKQTEYARIIHKSGSDLLNLINDILDLSKIEAGKVELNFEPVKLTEVAYDMEQLFSTLASEKKIRFNIDLSGTLPETLNTDRQRLGQVVKNLLSNSFKFTPEDGQVTLRFAVEGDSLALSVSDTGIGIAEEKQKLIFEAFQQADGSTSRKFGGTGLGLSISKELVSRLGGVMNLDSEPGRGSTFTVLLPLNGDRIRQEPQGVGSLTTAPEYDLDKVKEQTLIKDDKAEIRSWEQVILIIEDDPVFASIVHNFAHDRGYKTIVAISGDEGLLYARKYRPSAIILDLGLPVIDGRSILKIIKSDADLKDIPVHVLTAEDRSDILPEHVEGFFSKPLQRNELEQTFASIESYISSHYKNILIMHSGNKQLLGMFETLADTLHNGVAYAMAASKAQAKDVLAQKEIDCIIADIDGDIQHGINTLSELKEAASENVYIITCLEGDISVADEKQIKKYSDSIIRKSTQATSRLLDEVELFLHKIKTRPKLGVPSKFAGNLDKSLAGKKVLLADDDMRNVFALTALLEEQGMEVVAAEHGREALELLERNRDVDIVLMDIMMPEMDGYEAIRHIRANKRYARLPVIALTAKAMTGDREKCLEAGASDYITKPIENNKLFSLMRVWLSQ